MYSSLFIHEEKKSVMIKIMDPNILKRVKPLYIRRKMYRNQDHRMNVIVYLFDIFFMQKTKKVQFKKNGILAPNLQVQRLIGRIQRKGIL